MAGMSVEVKQAIDRAALRASRAAVRETLLTLGIDASSPDAIREAQQDFAFVRKLRLVSNVKALRYPVIVFSAAMTLVGAVATLIVQKFLGIGV